MTTITVPDDGGEEMTIFSYNGYNYPNFPHPESIINLSSVKIRSDDIIINAYPKSGTNWIYELIRLLLVGKTDLEATSKMVGMIEFVEEKTYKDLPSPRILNSHMLFRHLPEEVKKKKPRLVYITRNPKDVMVSYYNFICKVPFYKYTGDWKNYLKPALEGRFDYGSWFDYVKEWEEAKKTTDVPILTLNYEDMTEDTIREAKKLRDFLGVDRSDDFVSDVCDQCHFASMKKYKMEGLYADFVYRKGEVGDWKNWFTVTQNEWFDQLYQEKMKDCEIQFRYTL